MAGGSGKRMGHHLPKQLLRVGHVPMLVHLLDLAECIQIDVVLVLSQANHLMILEYLIGSSELEKLEHNLYTYRRIRVWVAIQDIANGTGGALIAARDRVFLSDSYNLDLSINHQILVLSADVPLLSTHSALTMLEMLRVNLDLKCVVYAQEREDPHGYGRIMMSPKGEVSIVEQKDIVIDVVEQVKLINTGIYAFNARSLFEALFHINANNAQREYYLTDVPKIIQRDEGIGTITLYKKNSIIDWDETMGANTPNQLEQIKSEYQKKFQILDLVRETDMTHSTLVEYLKCLSELTTVGLEYSTESIDRVRDFLLRTCQNDKSVFIIGYDGMVIGTFSILIEPKVIHQMSSVAHVEDVVIIERFRGSGLGKKIMAFVERFCQNHSQPIYKIILECSDDVIGFYEKNGYRRVGNSMRLDL